MRSAMIMLGLVPLLALSMPMPENETMIAEAKIEPRAVNESFVNETAEGEMFPRSTNETTFELEESTIEPRSANESEIASNETLSRRRRRSADDESFGNETMIAEKAEIEPRAANETSFVNETAGGEKIPRSVNESTANETLSRRRRSTDFLTNETMIAEESTIEPRAANESQIVGNETLANRRRRAADDESVLIPRPDAEPISETAPEGFDNETSAVDPDQAKFVHTLALLSEDLFMLAEKINATRPQISDDEENTTELETADDGEEKPDIVTDLTYLAEDLLTLSVHLNESSTAQSREPRNAYWKNGCYYSWRYGWRCNNHYRYPQWKKNQWQQYPKYNHRWHQGNKYY